MARTYRLKFGNHFVRMPLWLLMFIISSPPGRDSRVVVRVTEEEDS